MIGVWIRKFFLGLVLKERSSLVLGASFAMGTYIAFSPYLGLHTIMIFLFSWLFSLNYAVTFAAAYAINNPWTLVPVYSADYWFGEWLLRHILGIETLLLNPSWMEFINKPLQRVIGIEGVAFWSFMIGGNLLGLLLAGMLYIITKPIFRRLVEQVHGSEIDNSKKIITKT